MSETTTGSIGPSRAVNPSSLLQSQRHVVGLGLKYFIETAAAIISPHPRPVVTKSRPHQVLEIDGARGTGKTFVLLALENAMQALSEDWHSSATPGRQRNGMWDEFQAEYTHLPLLEAIPRGDSDGPRTLTETVNIIFPGDMEPRETVMESIIAMLMERLSAESGTRGEQDQFLDRLRKRLRDDVAQGWYFARNLGHEAVARDASNYRDFISRFEQETRKASQRIRNWHRFVEEYLNFKRSATLTIFLDDSDVRPELAVDILHSLRMFLVHPRIITVLAGNLRSMRGILVHNAMRDLGSRMKALGRATGQTADNWRRAERKAIEDYLEKVLPPSLRLYISNVSLDPTRGAEQDYIKLTETARLPGEFGKGQTLLGICEGMMKRSRAGFLDSKFRLALRKVVDQSDAPGERRRGLENYVAWWVFNCWYLGALAPRSARQILTFRDYYGVLLQEDAALTARRTFHSEASSRHRSEKRLIMALFDNPQNFSLIHQFIDNDSNVVTWLQHQRLDSKWVGQRLFHVNGRTLDQSSYGYDYIRFRLDVGLAMPLRENADDAVPRTLLPVPTGRRHIRRFFQPHGMARRQRRIGVAKWIDHAAIPGNCLYFYDLEALPDCSLRAGSVEELRTSDAQSHQDPTPGGWEAWLAQNWMDVIEDEQDEAIYRYFVDVICASQRGLAKVSTSTLLSLLDPYSLITEQKEAVYEHLLGLELDSFGKYDSSGPAGQWNEILALESSEAADRADTRRRLRRLALYAALVSDLRRAWHAIRIYEHSSSATHWRPAHSQDERSSFTVIAASARLKLYTYEEFNRLLTGSRWVEALFSVFSKESFVAAIEQVARQPEADATVRRLLDKNDIQHVFSADTPAGAQSVLGEARDFRQWTQIWRSLGRISCQGWPDYGDPEEKSAGSAGDRYDRVEETLFLKQEEHRLHIRRKKATGHQTDQGINDAQASREHGQAARHFVWLIYGIAPSLPAMIHTDIMSILFQAEVNRVAIGDIQDAQDHLDVEDLQRMIGQFEAAKDAIKNWAGLIGKIAATMRYVRVKYLHLHLGLLAEHIVSPPGGKSGSPSTSGASLSQEWTNALKKAVDLNDPASPGDVAEAWFRLFVGVDQEMDRSLAIMPDVATSTLFGDAWLEDTLRSLANSGRLPCTAKSGNTTRKPTGDMLQVTGVFAETEQWLWASHRCLRKLREGTDKKIDDSIKILNSLKTKLNKSSSSDQKDGQTSTPDRSATPGRRRRTKETVGV